MRHRGVAPWRRRKQIPCSGHYQSSSFRCLSGTLSAGILVPEAVIWSRRYDNHKRWMGMGIGHIRPAYFDRLEGQRSVHCAGNVDAVGEAHAQRAEDGDRERETAYRTEESK